VTCRANQLLDLGDSENVRQRLNPRHLDDLDPAPVERKNMLPEELQANAVDFDGTPRMGIDSRSEVDLQQESRLRFTKHCTFAPLSQTE
jgi:hypothetical protein